MKPKLSPTYRRKLFEIIQHKRFLGLERDWQGWKIDAATKLFDGWHSIVDYYGGGKLDVAIDEAHKALFGKKKT